MIWQRCVENWRKLRRADSYETDMEQWFEHIIHRLIIDRVLCLEFYV